jgi:hypothetical protein
MYMVMVILTLLFCKMIHQKEEIGGMGVEIYCNGCKINLIEYWF